MKPGVLAALLLLKVGNLCGGRRYIRVNIPFIENVWCISGGGGAIPCTGCLGCIVKAAPLSHNPRSHRRPAVR
jgi:hypothetical protein